MAFAYIDRLVTLTNITLHASNWRRIVLGALILASKGSLPLSQRAHHFVFALTNCASVGGHGGMERGLSDRLPRCVHPGPQQA